MKRFLAVFVPVILTLLGCGSIDRQQPENDATAADVGQASDEGILDAGQVDDASFPIVDSFVVPNEGDAGDVASAERCSKHDDCNDDKMCFLGHCLDPCVEVPEGYTIIATVSAESDPFGMPVGQEFSYGTRLCITRWSAVEMNVLTPVGAYLASTLAVDNQGRNCGHEGARNMRPLNRFLFQHGHVPEDFGMELECLGLGAASHMSWVRRVLPQ